MQARDIVMMRRRVLAIHGISSFDSCLASPRRRSGLVARDASPSSSSEQRAVGVAPLEHMLTPQRASHGATCLATPIRGGADASLSEALVERHAEIRTSSTSENLLQGQVEQTTPPPWMASTQALVERRHSSEPVDSNILTVLSSSGASALAHSQLRAQLLMNDGHTPTIVEWRNRPQLRQQFWACLRCADTPFERSTSAHLGCRFLLHLMRSRLE